MNIYILQGSCGEYSDRIDWIVRAYKYKEQADADRTKADYEVGAVIKKLNGEYWRNLTPSEKEMLTVDPKAQLDYTLTTYWVTEVELL